MTCAVGVRQLVRGHRPAGAAPSGTRGGHTPVLAHQLASARKRWPKGSSALSNAIRKVLPSLRENGISVTFPGPTGHSRSRQIEILSIPAEDKGKRSSVSSDETLFSPEKIKGDPADDRPERPDDADDFFPLSSAERPNSEEEVFEL